MNMKRIQGLLLCWLLLQILWLPAALALPTPRPTPIPTAAPAPSPTAEPTRMITAAPTSKTQKEGFPDPAAYFGECNAALTAGTADQTLRVYSPRGDRDAALGHFLQAVEQAGGSCSTHDLAGRVCYLIQAKGSTLILLPEGDNILLVGDPDALLTGAAPTASPVPRAAGQWMQVTHREKCGICGGTGKCNICHGTGKYSLPGFQAYAVDCDPDCKYCDNGFRVWTVTEWVTPAP